jgi:hypothetical protein
MNDDDERREGEKVLDTLWALVARIIKKMGEEKRRTEKRKKRNVCMYNRQTGM